MLKRNPVLAVAIVALSACGGESRAEGGAWSLPEASSTLLAVLPDGEEKRAFILDCTGCHTMGRDLVFPDGSARSRDDWRAVVQRMVDMAGAGTAFPIISHARSAEATADWLATWWTAPPAPGGDAPQSATEFEVVEFPFPQPMDLPHDVAVDADGRVVVTGMFSHAMKRLDPATGAWERIPIPVPHANPRALELDAQGRWWVLLGAAQRIARYEPSSGHWSSWSIPFYGHSIRVAEDGRVWVNGHFTNDPTEVIALDPSDGAATTYSIPTPPELRAGAGPIPYGLRPGPDGSVWGTELYGGRIFRLAPEAGDVRAWDIPWRLSGPRRPAFDRAGGLWIPLYAANRLVRFDPATETFQAWTLPVPDALPYVVVVDDQRERIWVGTAAADAVFLFRPGSETWETVPLPSTGALVRHADIDPRNGDLWIAYGASPGIPARIARVRGP